MSETTEYVDPPEVSDAPDGADTTPANAYPEPRPATLADELRSAVASKISNLLSETNGDLPAKLVYETAGRSVLVELNDDSRLLIQIASIPADVDLDFTLPDHDGESTDS